MVCARWRRRARGSFFVARAHAPLRSKNNQEVSHPNCCIWRWWLPSSCADAGEVASSRSASASSAAAAAAAAPRPQRAAAAIIVQQKLRLKISFNFRCRMAGARGCARASRPNPRSSFAHLLESGLAGPSERTDTSNTLMSSHKIVTCSDRVAVGSRCAGGGGDRRPSPASCAAAAFAQTRAPLAITSPTTCSIDSVHLIAPLDHAFILVPNQQDTHTH